MSIDKTMDGKLDDLLERLKSEKKEYASISTQYAFLYEQLAAFSKSIISNKKELRRAVRGMFLEDILKNVRSGHEYAKYAVGVLTDKDLAEVTPKELLIAAAHLYLCEEESVADALISCAYCFQLTYELNRDIMKPGYRETVPHVGFEGKQSTRRYVMIQEFLLRKKVPSLVNEAYSLLVEQAPHIPDPWPVTDENRIEVAEGVFKDPEVLRRHFEKIIEELTHDRRYKRAYLVGEPDSMAHFFSKYFLDHRMRDGKLLVVPEAI